MKARFLLTALAAILAMAGPPASAVPPGTPDGSLVWTPGQPVADRDVTFGVSVRDPDGAILSVRVDFGDGTYANLATASRSTVKDVTACAFGDTFTGSVRHRYATPGVYQAKLTVVAGSCPLTGVLQETSWIKGYELRVVSAASGPAGGATSPVGGLSGISR
ncbi:MAG TPA: PKD domain-containing protein [Actinomycetota bacterium]